MNTQTGKLILINGASSAGKTSTVRALQNLLDEFYLCLGINSFWQAMPAKQLDIHTATPDYYRHRQYQQGGLAHFEIIPGPKIDQCMMTSYHAIAAYLAAGVNVVSEQLFWKPEWFAAALSAFCPYHVFYVGLHVSDEEGARREQMRSKSYDGNALEAVRHEGWNRCSAIATHKNMSYDYEIDNSELSIEETAKQIYSAFVDSEKPQAFRQLYETWPKY